MVVRRSESFSRQFFIRLNIFFSRYCYHTCGLVSLSFDRCSPGPVSPPPPFFFFFLLFSFVWWIFNVDDICSAFTSTLINGKGRYLGGPSNISLAVVNVQQGKRSVLCLTLWVWDFSCAVITVTDSGLSPSLATLASFSPLTATKWLWLRLRARMFSLYSSMGSVYLLVRKVQKPFILFY